eukprot:1492108-Pyramimonas_sp.AAC.1
MAQAASKTAQEGPKNAPRERGPRGEHESTFRALGPEKTPGVPKRLQRDPKTPPTGPQRAPRGPQAAPGGPQEAQII